MKDLKELLRPLVEKAIDEIEKGVDFTIEQAPLLVQEFYNWHIAETIFFLVLSIILLSMPYFMHRLVKRFPLFSEAFIGAPILVSVFSVTIGVCMFIVSLLDLIKLLVAPRLYLIEYFLN